MASLQTVAWEKPPLVSEPPTTTPACPAAPARRADGHRFRRQAEKLPPLLALAPYGQRPGLRDRLWKLLEVEAGSRFAAVERLRTAPARVSGPEMVRSLERAAEVAGVGAGTVDVSGVPASRLVALARYGVTAKAAALRDLAELRRTATLVAALQSLERTAVDDALDLFDVLMASRLLGSRRGNASGRCRASPGPRPSWQPPTGVDWSRTIADR